MSIAASLLAVLVWVAAKMTAVRSKYFQEHAKDLPQVPLGR